MGEKSNIHWTDSSWNPVTGCSHVSPGCENCYAEALSLRMGWSQKPWKAQNAPENVVLHPERVDAPLHWSKPRRIFVNSMSDLFHELVPESFIDQVFAVMERCPRHTFQVLTKRPERMLEYVTNRWDKKISYLGPETAPASWIGYGYFPSHIWLGTSVEDQRRANERIPLLLETPATVRFLSCEPLLGPVDLSSWVNAAWWAESETVAILDGFTQHVIGHRPGRTGWHHVSKGKHGLHWVIVGGESGKNYRPMDPQWARDIRDACQAAEVPFFFKQSSALRPGQGRELDGELWEQYPDQTQVAWEEWSRALLPGAR